MDMQFYPTPEDLAKRAWGKFKNKDYVKVLEPSAGEGHLAEACPRDYYGGKSTKADCIELDVTKHPLLRDKGFDVIGVDFLSYDGPGAMYSHIIMNPPFAQGVQHVLKAWDILYDGEIVAILNAETIRNPFSKEREMLVRLIEQNGDVEYIEGAFAVEDAERKTEVEVALVYLCKKAPFYADLMGDILDSLKIDQAEHTLSEGFEQRNEVMIPASYIENSVINFNAAVEAMRQSAFATARAELYAARVGRSMEEMGSDKESKHTGKGLEAVQQQMHKDYLDLKNRAWTGIVRSTEVMSKLSSAAQRRLESEFEQIKRLEFTVSNVYGLLIGLLEKRGEIQMQMMLDIFDEITRYHTDNAYFYKGWKSNDKHRTCGIRIKTTRFVLPRHTTDSWSRGMSWDSMRLLADFDKVFAMLDSKLEPEVSLCSVFTNSFNELRAGQRISSSYFDCRYYRGIGTIHFFPRDKKLIDRLNRLVGQQRKWLPPEGEKVSDQFWLQYDKADSFDKEIRAEVKKSTRYSWDDPLHGLFINDDRGELAQQRLGQAIDNVLTSHGIDPVAMLEASAEPNKETPQLPLLAAA
jgi:hypothetical protein